MASLDLFNPKFSENPYDHGQRFQIWDVKKQEKRAGRSFGSGLELERNVTALKERDDLFEDCIAELEWLANLQPIDVEHFSVQLPEVANDLRGPKQEKTKSSWITSVNKEFVLILAGSSLLALFVLAFVAGGWRPELLWASLLFLIYGIVERKKA